MNFWLLCVVKRFTIALDHIIQNYTKKHSKDNEMNSFLDIYAYIMLASGRIKGTSEKHVALGLLVSDLSSM